MDECRAIFIDLIIDYYYNYVDEDYKKENIYRLIEQYFQIKIDVSKMEEKLNKERKFK